MMSPAARLVIFGVIAAMIVSLVEIGVLSVLRIDIPAALLAVPGLALTGLIGLLGKTHAEGP